jgi:pimeloyl-ACP methyl ester carboxylesterase
MNIIVDGILTNYEVLGDRQAKNTLVFLHGWGRSLSDWKNLIKNYQKDYQIILLDLPGFGSSSKPNTDFDIYDYAKFTQEFLEKIKINKCILVGHSFGGRIGILLASHTDLVKKLILISSGGIETKNFITKIRILIIKLLKPVTKLLPKSFKAIFGSPDYKSAGIMRKTFIKVVNQDLTKHFSQIKIPTLIIWGEKDQVLPVKMAKLFKKLIDKSILKIVWGADHDSHINNADKTSEIITEFL